MAGFGTYLRAAFSARPLGMPVPPNWIALAAAGLLGWFVHPGLWLIAGGLELGYLMALTSNVRFRAVIDAAGRPVPPSVDRRAALFTQLDDEARGAQEALEARCREVLAVNGGDDPLLVQQEEQLRQLCWLRLRLLAARSSVQSVARTGGSERRELTKRLADLEKRRDAAASDLASSIEGQAAIVRSRLAQFDEAGGRLDYLDAELDRLRQQVELLRDQALLAAGGTDGAGLSSTIAGLGESLQTTNRWMRDQRLTADAAWEQAPPLPSTEPANRSPVRA